MDVLLSPADEQLFLTLWNSNLKNPELCARFNITPAALYKLKKRHNLPKRENPGHAYVDPTPEDIARECAIFRAGWPPEEEERRRVGYRPRRLELFCV
jgi:hypothetical protein